MNATIYIRKENEEAWKNIADKSEWVNTLLKNLDKTPEREIVKNPPIANTYGFTEFIAYSPKPSPRKGLIGNSEGVKVFNDFPGMCEHGAGVKMCKNSKCKNYQFK